MRIDVPFKQWILGTDIMQRRKKLKYALNIIENERLKTNQCIAGNVLSIADILCYAEMSQLDAWNLLGEGTDLGFDGDGSKYMRSHYPNIYQWMLKMRKLPKHKEAHKIMIIPPMLKHVANRKVAVSKAMKQYLSKL